MKKFLTLFAAILLFGSMTVKADFYVAGTFNNWNAGHSDYKMSGSDPYSVTKQLNSGAYQFKITSGSWSWSTNAYDNSVSNVTLSIVEGNIAFSLTTICDVTFYYNESTGKAYVQATPAPDSWTVAGSNETLFGTPWTPGNNVNDMALVGELYTWSKEDVTLGASTIEFKVCKNHAWDEAYPSSNYQLSISEDGIYDITITFNEDSKTVNATAAKKGSAVVIPTIKLHGTFTGSWADTEEFEIASGNETASLTLTNVPKGNYNFGVRIDGSWTSNGSAFTRANNSHEIVSGNGDCAFYADRKGDYTFTWTYATNMLEISYPAVPAQNVVFDGLPSQILKGTINLTNYVTSSGIDEPGYRFYVKEKGGSYGSAVNSNYTFDAIGEYVIKVEALEYNSGEPVAEDESEVLIYDAHTFTSGTILYVDFSAVDGNEKGVNFPKVNEAYLDYDAEGAGTCKTITFEADVTWTTMDDAFIKTEKAGWAALKFSVPGDGQNKVIVAADGASYTWDTYNPIKLHGDFTGSWVNTDAFVVAGNKETASLILTDVAVGDYQFGVRIGSDNNWTSNGSAFTRENNSYAIVAGDGNCTFKADVAGDYTFTWTYASNTLEVTYPDVPEPEAFVAGSETEIFGVYWDGSAVANKMTWNEGLSKYTKTYTVDKAYKSVALKVVYDGNWYGVEGGANNVKFSLSGAGEFTVLFDKDNHYVTLDGAIVGDEQFDFEYVAVAGNGSTESNWMNGEVWNPAAASNRMTEVQANIYEISFSNVEGAVSQFQFTFDGGWEYQFGGVFESFGAASTAVYGGGGNITFTPVAGAAITIRLDLSNFNFATKEGATFTVSQVEPAPQYETVRAELTAGKYYTLCYNKTMTAIQGASLWSFAGKDASKAIIVEAEAPYVAGTPYLIYAESDKLEAVLVTVDDPVAGNHNGLYGTLSYMDADALAAAGATHMLKSNEIRPLGTNNHLDAQRAYIKISEIPDAQQAAPGRRVRAIPMQENTATDLEGLEATDAPVKVLIDGQIYILRGEKMFDTTGRMVK